jgi:hypothetical protein
MELCIPQPGRSGLERFAVERLDFVALPLAAFERDHAALRRESRLGHAPAIVLCADHVFGRNPDIRQEQLAGHCQVNRGWRLGGR